MTHPTRPHPDELADMRRPERHQIILPIAAIIITVAIVGWATMREMQIPPLRPAACVTLTGDECAAWAEAR